MLKNDEIQCSGFRRFFEYIDGEKDLEYMG